MLLSTYVYYLLSNSSVFRVLYLKNLLNQQHLESKCRLLTATIENPMNADYDLQ